jgi:thiol-disulfide isomerase/thioredoxin
VPGLIRRMDARLARGVCRAGGAAWRRLARALVRAIAATAVLAAGAGVAATPGGPPAFTHMATADWLNSPPLTSRDLAGHPVLIEVWTYECSNCRATLPWMRRVAREYQPRGLVIVAVHAPELAAEHDPANVASAVRRLGISYPVMLDQDFSYWRALGNRYWPAFYLYDAAGRLLDTRIGELHAGEANTDAFERLLARQLPAPPPVVR